MGVAIMVAAGSVLAASPAPAAQAPAICQFLGDEPLFGNIEPPLQVDASCIDPDYNANTLVIDSTQQLVYTDLSGRAILYTEVKAHFPATNTRATLPNGVYFSATLNRHDVVWRFPAKEFWQNRSFQHTYPLQGTGPLDLNEVDLGFAFTNGAFTVKVNPGNPNTGYRVNAAATKLAWAYANEVYGNSGRIYSYLWGQSGGSVQAFGAAEGTTGVWAGVIPAVIATSGLNVHSFQWQAHYALAIPQQKRTAIGQAAEPGSGRSIYDGLNAEERAVLDELLQSGYPRDGLGAALSLDLVTGDEIPVGDSVGQVVGPFPGVAGPSLLIPTGTGEIRRLDPTYEEDFWSEPGYQGTDPPDYLTDAKVDGFATITDIVRDAQGVPVAVKLDPDTVPELGSIGATNLEYYVYGPDSTTRTIDDSDPARPVHSLTGTLDTETSTLVLAADTTRVPPRTTNSAVLLDALSVGGKIRINNRFFLAAVYYPRYSNLKNGNPAYSQYLNDRERPKYPQRAVQTAYLSNIRSMGGIHETGAVTTKTMVMENLLDTFSHPYVAGFYSEQVQSALGRRKAENMHRVYYQENAGHSNGGLVEGIFNQMLLDLIAWAEQEIEPKPSSRYTIDPMTQIVQPLAAADRKGLQPVVHLSANGRDRAEVGIQEEVALSATAEMPPDTGELVQYSWTVEQQGVPAVTEPAAVLDDPDERVTVNRTMRFTQPGEYLVTLNVSGDRNGMVGTPTEVKNLDTIRVVVR